MRKQEKIKSHLNNSIADGAANSAKTSITGTYLTPFALALGANVGEIGLLNSIPNLAGTLIQPFVGKYIRRMKGRKPACLWAALLSRLLLVPIALIPFIFTSNPVLWLIGLFSLSQLTSSIATTAWASWIGDLVPRNIMGRFFGKRNAIAGAVSFVTILIAGTLLTTIDSSFGFTTILLLASVAGLISVFFLRRIPDIPFRDGQYRMSTIREFRTELRSNKNFRRFVIYLAAFNLAVYIASPFFAVSMLEDFKIGYETYAIITAISIIATIISQPYWGRLADRFGDRAILAVTSVLATLVPGLWLFASEPISMAAVLIFSAFGWAGFDLATFNYLLGASKHKPSYIANYSMLTGFAIFTGPLIGGALAEMGVSMMMFSGLSVLFLVSFIFRAIFSALLVPTLSEVRPAKHVPPVPILLWKSMTVYPFRFFMHELSVAQHYIHHKPRQ